MKSTFAIIVGMAIFLLSNFAKGTQKPHQPTLDQIMAEMALLRGKSGISHPTAEEIMAEMALREKSGISHPTMEAEIDLGGNSEIPQPTEDSLIDMHVQITTSTNDIYSLKVKNVHTTTPLEPMIRLLANPHTKLGQLLGDKWQYERVLFRGIQVNLTESLATHGISTDVWLTAVDDGEKINLDFVAPDSFTVKSTDVSDLMI